MVISLRLVRHERTSKHFTFLFSQQIISYSKHNPVKKENNKENKRNFGWFFGGQRVRLGPSGRIHFLQKKVFSDRRYRGQRMITVSSQKYYTIEEYIKNRYCFLQSWKLKLSEEINFLRFLRASTTPLYFKFNSSNSNKYKEFDRLICILCQIWCQILIKMYAYMHGMKWVFKRVLQIEKFSVFGIYA